MNPVEPFALVLCKHFSNKTAKTLKTLYFFTKHKYINSLPKNIQNWIFSGKSLIIQIRTDYLLCVEVWHAHWNIWFTPKSIWSIQHNNSQNKRLKFYVHKKYKITFLNIKLWQQVFLSGKEKRNKNTHTHTHRICHVISQKSTKFSKSSLIIHTNRMKKTINCVSDGWAHKIENNIFI